jgi:hypothetical protein
MQPAQCGQLKVAGKCSGLILDDFPDLEAEDLNAGLSDAAWEIPAVSGKMLWLNSQLLPLLASWIQSQEWGIQAFAARDVGRRAARHPVIFRAAQEAWVVVLTKERDNVRLLDEQGPPLQEIRDAVYGYVETAGGVSVRCWGHGLRDATAWSDAPGCPAAGGICLLLPAVPNRVMG